MSWRASKAPRARIFKNIFRARDFAWLLFVGALLATSPETNYNAAILLVVIGAFQIIEPRLHIFASESGRLWSLLLKLVFSYLLVGYTHGIESYYYPIFLVPAVSAATSYSFAVVLFVTGLAGIAYFSFLLPIYIDWNTYRPVEGLYSLLFMRVAFFAIISFLVFDQARAKRQEMARTKDAADRLAESNKSLQQAQASLRRSERLAALGQLTAGLAHELRNPLGTIKASAEMLNQKSVLERPQVMTEMASYIESEVDRMNSLITSFLNFARPLEVHAVLGDLEAVLSDVIRSQTTLAVTSDVALQMEISRGARHFVFDPALLTIALSNLVRNAIQASPPQSRVRITATEGEQQVAIEVEDAGRGISPQDLENIFNPFFTTKAEGVGLGLAIVSKIIDEHQGKIVATSTPGEGATFRITLPAPPLDT